MLGFLILQILFIGKPALSFDPRLLPPACVIRETRDFTFINMHCLEKEAIARRQALPFSLDCIDQQREAVARLNNRCVDRYAQTQKDYGARRSYGLMPGEPRDPRERSAEYGFGYGLYPEAPGFEHRRPPAIPPPDYSPQRDFAYPPPGAPIAPFVPYPYPPFPYPPMGPPGFVPF